MNTPSTMEVDSYSPHDNNVKFGNEHMHNVRDILNAFYDWYLAGCPGVFSNDNGLDCWMASWNRTHCPSFATPSYTIFIDLYQDLHRFLSRVESLKGLCNHVHFILLLHSIFDDYSRGVHQRFTQFRGMSPTVSLVRMLTMSSVDLIGEVWSVYTIFAHYPQVLIPRFFIFLAENCQTVLAKRIDWLVTCERAARATVINP